MALMQWEDDASQLVSEVFVFYSLTSLVRAKRLRCAQAHVATRQRLVRLNRYAEYRLCEKASVTCREPAQSTLALCPVTARK